MRTVFAPQDINFVTESVFPILPVVPIPTAAPIKAATTAFAAALRDTNPVTEHVFPILPVVPIQTAALTRFVPTELV